MHPSSFLIFATLLFPFSSLAAPVKRQETAPAEFNTLGLVGGTVQFIGTFDLPTVISDAQSGINTADVINGLIVANFVTNVQQFLSTPPSVAGVLYEAIASTSNTQFATLAQQAITTMEYSYPTANTVIMNLNLVRVLQQSNIDIISGTIQQTQQLLPSMSAAANGDSDLTSAVNVITGLLASGWQAGQDLSGEIPIITTILTPASA